MANLQVEILIDELICQRISYEPGLWNTRDEVYVRVVGETPSGKTVEARLPRYIGNDDYYEFFNSSIAKTSDPWTWRNQHQAPVGPPRIWAGTLKPGESAKFWITIQEQDNKDVGAIKAAILSFLDSEAVKKMTEPKTEEKPGTKALSPGTVLIIVDLAKRIVNLLPDNKIDDTIGAFFVEVKNKEGKLHASWLATDLEEFSEEGEFATTKINGSGELLVEGVNSVNLDFDGTRGAKYSGVAKVNSYASLPDDVKQARRYLGRYTADRCSNAIVKLNGIKVRKGQLKEVRGTFNSRLKWQCGSNDETSAGTTPTGTDLILVARASSGRDISWFFFNEEAYTAK